VFARNSEAVEGGRVGGDFDRGYQINWAAIGPTRKKAIGVDF
jgi:hypothetical protein